MSGKNLRNLAEVVRDEMVMKEKIMNFLEGGPKTFPEMAKHLGKPVNEVIYWMMSLRRYGEIEEIGKANADGYFSYEAVHSEKEAH